MPTPKEVINVQVSEGTRFIPGGGAVQVRIVQYFVRPAGANEALHGPFFFTKPVNEFSDEEVQREMEKTVRSLRGIGASVATG